MGEMEEQAALRRWRRDPVAFIRGALIDPETGGHFELYPAEERFLRAGFTPGRDGRLPFAELLYAAPKKSGKTALAAMATLYTVICIGGPYAEAYCVANDFEQAQGRVFQAIARIIEASPLLVSHRIFQPSPTSPLDFEQTIEKTLLELRDRFQVRGVRFDPYQMQATAQRLARSGLPMVEFPQSVPNLTEASSNLYELIKGRNLAVYSDPEIRLAISRCVALETSRGWRIAEGEDLAQDRRRGCARDGGAGSDRAEARPAGPDGGVVSVSRSAPASRG